MRRVVKSCMKSHRIRIPNYDFPIRLRPVCSVRVILNTSFNSFYEVVPRIHEHYHGSSGVSGLHRLCATAATK